MKILVTGSNGQLGMSLRKIESAYPSHDFIFTDMPEADITDENVISRLVKDNGIDLIVNCAAYTAVDKAETEHAIALKVNAGGVRILAQIAKENGLPMVHISTDYVFEGTGVHPLKETDAVNPISVYGKTKLDGENAVRDSGCRAAVIRSSWLYSEFGNNFVRTMIRLGREKDEIDVVYDQIGTPTYAEDLAEAIMKIAGNGIEGFNVYHYSNEGVASWYDFAKMIFRISEIDVRVNPVESSAFPTKAKRPSYSVLSKDKIKNVGVEVPYWVDSLNKCIVELNNNRQ